MRTEQNPPAFPRDHYEGHSGMSLRDWFAGQALAGIVQRGEKRSADQAFQAYSCADAMLAERAK